MFRNTIVSSLLLFWSWHGTNLLVVVDAAPCASLGTKEACQAAASLEGQDVACFWCENLVLCTEVEADCAGGTGMGGESGMPGGGGGAPGSGGVPEDGLGQVDGEKDPIEGGNGTLIEESMDFFCFPQAEENCAVNGCFWCSTETTCRASFGDCSGNENIDGRPNLCAPLKNETGCTENGCFWCDDMDLCRSSQEACPGQGRGNACREQQEDTCDATEGCAWLDFADRCGSERGNAGNRTEALPRGSNLCPLLTDEGNCTMSVYCRWCTSNSVCQTRSEVCEDGTLGLRGNPCRTAETEELCTNIDSCLWCTEEQKCRKATNLACLIGDDEDLFNEILLSGNFTGDVCRLLDARPECDEFDECQWCEAQSRCKNNVTLCRDPSGAVDIDFENLNGGFKILDDGLGPTDPNAVSVVLAYLYEITSEGGTIGTSLVDLESQEYFVKQSIDVFSGEIKARKIQFETTIDGVGTIELIVFVMLDDGDIQALGGTEVLPVEAGDVKFNVELKDWTFCDESDTCGDTLGSSYIDLAFEIKGLLDDPEESDTNALLFDLGGNVPLLLSDKVSIDGVIQDMPAGFPRAESTELQGTVFVFRFPRFQATLEYDPIIPYHFSIPILADPNAAPVPPPTAMPTSPKPQTEAPPTAAPKSVDKEIKNKEEDDSLSGGSMAGIVVGSLVGLCCCCAAIGAIAVSQRKGSEEVPGEPDEKNNLTYDGDEAFDDEMNAGAKNDVEESGDDDDDDDEESGEEESDGDDDDDESSEE